MKFKFIKTGIAAAVIAVIAVTGCKKETTPATMADDSANYQTEVMVNDADQNYNETVVSGGDETTAFSAVNGGLPEVYTLVETDMDDAGMKRGDEKRFFTCLKKLNLSDTQVTQLRKALRAFEECKAGDIRKHREAYEKLSDSIEHQRQEIATHLKLGKIDKAEFEKEMKALRMHFEASLKRIKLAYAKTLRACYEKYTKANREILTEHQWKAFVDCYK